MVWGVGCGVGMMLEGVPPLAFRGRLLVPPLALLSPPPDSLQPIYNRQHGRCTALQPLGPGRAPGWALRAPVMTLSLPQDCIVFIGLGTRTPWTR